MVESWDGSDSDNELRLKSSACRDGDQVLGTPPVRPQPCASRIARLGRTASSGGMVPDSEGLLKRRRELRRSDPSSEGMVPLRARKREGKNGIVRFRNMHNSTGSARRGAGMTENDGTAEGRPPTRATHLSSRSLRTRLTKKAAGAEEPKVASWLGMEPLDK